MADVKRKKGRRECFFTPFSTCLSLPCRLKEVQKLKFFLCTLQFYAVNKNRILQGDLRFHYVHVPNKLKIKIFSGISVACLFPFIYIK